MKKYTTFFLLLSMSACTFTTTGATKHRFSTERLPSTSRESAEACIEDRLFTTEGKNSIESARSKSGITQISTVEASFKDKILRNDYCTSVRGN
jgi:TRL-like protein family